MAMSDLLLVQPVALGHLHDQTLPSGSQTNVMKPRLRGCLGARVPQYVGLVNLLANDGIDRRELFAAAIEKFAPRALTDFFQHSSAIHSSAFGRGWRIASGITSGIASRISPRIISGIPRRI